MTEALAKAPAFEPLPAIATPLPAAAHSLAATPAPPATALPNSKPINYALVNQPEVAESREHLRNMQAALSSKGDGGAPALNGHYDLRLTPGVGGGLAYNSVCLVVSLP